MSLPFSLALAVFLPLFFLLWLLPLAYRMNLSKGPLVNSSSEDNSKSTYGKCGAGAWRMHQSYDPLEANHMRDAHALYNPRLDKMIRGRRRKMTVNVKFSFTLETGKCEHCTTSEARVF